MQWIRRLCTWWILCIIDGTPLTNTVKAMLDFLARRRLRKQFMRYLQPKAVRDLADGGTLDTSKIQSGHIDFVFAFVRAETPEELGRRVGHVADVGMEHEATVYDLLGPMVVMAFGTLGPARPSGSRQQLVSHLVQQFGADIKIVHGAADGHFGTFGSRTRLSYTFTFPSFDLALMTLGQLEFGQTEELHT